MVVLVTGAAGFIGSHVVQLLLSEGNDVRATVRNLKNAQFLESFTQNERSSLEIVQMDLLESESVRAAVEGCKTVIHCAASLMVDVKDPQRDVVDPSVTGTLNLCEAIRLNESIHTIIHTSSVAAIRRIEYENGQTFTSKDWCDDATLKSNPYGLAKAEAEQKMRAFVDECHHSERKIRLVTVHPSIVFGPVFHKRHTRGSMAYLKHYRRSLSDRKKHSQFSSPNHPPTNLLAQEFYLFSPFLFSSLDNNILLFLFALLPARMRLPLLKRRIEVVRIIDLHMRS